MLPPGCGFNIFRIFERRNVDQQVQPQHSSASVENCGSWLLSCFRTIDSPKPLNNAGIVMYNVLQGVFLVASLLYNTQIDLHYKG